MIAERTAAPLAGLALALLGACGKGAPPAAFGRPPSPVTVFAAVARDVAVYLDEIGKVQASETVAVRPQVSGPVTEVHFQDGADVKAGDPLFTIDPRPYDARLAEARARAASAAAAVVQARAARDTSAARVATARSRHEEALAHARSAAANAEAATADVAAAEADAARAAEDARRFESAGAGSISQQELARVRAEARSAEARGTAAKRREAAAVADAAEQTAAGKSAEQAIREAEAQQAEAEARITSALAEADQANAAVETARIDVERCVLRAPIAGRAGRRLADVGNVVTPASAPLLSIQRLDPVYVAFSIVEERLPAVQRAMAARPLEAEVRLPGDDALRRGPLTFLDNAVQPSTGTVELRATLANSDGRFWPGRFAHVRLVLDVRAGAVLVPAAAPQVSAAGAFVYVVTADSTAEMRPVAVGQRHGDLVVLEKGVAAGERVVVEGQLAVGPGAKVRVVEPPPPAGGGAPAAGTGMAP